MDLKLPTKRLIVFSGSQLGDNRIEALKECQAEAVMYSFLRARDSAREDEAVRAAFKTWPTIRYLDSGVFTFLRAAGKVKYAKNKTVALTRETLKTYAVEYLTYLKAHGDDWDWIVELDVDDIFDHETTLWYRRQLREVVGDRLIPVWHRPAGEMGWANICGQYPYVGIGSDADRDPKHYRRLVGLAHMSGVAVHGFGAHSWTLRNEVAYDSVDSVNWVAAVSYGAFGGINFNRKNLSVNEMRRVQRGGFLEYVEKLGYKPEDLLAKGSDKIKFIVGIKRLQEQQNSLPAIGGQALHDA